MPMKTKKIMSDLLAVMIPLLTALGSFADILIDMDELIDETLEDDSKGQARKSRKPERAASAADSTL